MGGLSEGFYQAGFTPLAAVELDQHMASCYAVNHRRRSTQPKVLNVDIRSLDPKDLMQKCKLKSGELPILIGGPPCQGFSPIGKRSKDDERNKLIHEFPRFLRVLKSQAFMIENVPGLLNLEKDQLDSLMEALVSAGYKNTTYRLVNAAVCGVPQRRTRIIIYGTRNGVLPDFGVFDLPDYVGTTVWEAIGDLPSPLHALRNHELGKPIPYANNDASTYARGLRRRANKVTRWEPVKHSPKIVKVYGRLEHGETDPATKCWRLVPDGFARTLRAGSHTRTACRPVHPYEPRVITVREAARLHSFPDFLLLPPRVSSAHVAIGNSVPPTMARVLAKAFSRIFGEED